MGQIKFKFDCDSPGWTGAVILESKNEKKIKLREHLKLSIWMAKENKGMVKKLNFVETFILHLLTGCFIAWTFLY